MTSRSTSGQRVQYVTAGSGYCTWAQRLDGWSLGRLKIDIPALLSLFSVEDVWLSRFAKRGLGCRDC